MLLGSYHVLELQQGGVALGVQEVSGYLFGAVHPHPHALVLLVAAGPEGGARLGLDGDPRVGRSVELLTVDGVVGLVQDHVVGGEGDLFR